MVKGQEVYILENSKAIKVRVHKVYKRKSFEDLILIWRAKNNSYSTVEYDASDLHTSLDGLKFSSVSDEIPPFTENI